MASSLKPPLIEAPSLPIGQRFVEIASSLEPRPVARLLEEITTLRAELNQKNARYFEQSDSTIRACKTRTEYPENMREHSQRPSLSLQGSYHARFQGLLEKVRATDYKWDSLQAQATSLKSQLDDLRTSSSVNEELTGILRQIDSGDVHGAIAVKKLVQARQSLKNELDDLQRANVTAIPVSGTPCDGQATEAWQEEKCQLLDRLKSLEMTIVHQRQDIADRDEFIKQLQTRINEDASIAKARDFQLAEVRQKNVFYSLLVKDFVQGCRDLEDDTQRHINLATTASENRGSNTGHQNGLQGVAASGGREFTTYVQNDIASGVNDKLTKITTRPITDAECCTNQAFKAPQSRIEEVSSSPLQGHDGGCPLNSAADDISTRKTIGTTSKFGDMKIPPHGSNGIQNSATVQANSTGVTNPAQRGHKRSWADLADEERVVICFPGRQERRFPKFSEAFKSSSGDKPSMTANQLPQRVLSANWRSNSTFGQPAWSTAPDGRLIKKENFNQYPSQLLR